MIHFTKHAEDKLEILARHGVEVSREKVVRTVEVPDTVDMSSRFPLIIAQSSLDVTHVLRVVYKQEGTVKYVITFYPGRKTQYE